MDGSFPPSSKTDIAGRLVPTVFGKFATNPGNGARLRIADTRLARLDDPAINPP
jgi:hypothetical protein